MAVPNSGLSYSPLLGSGCKVPCPTSPGVFHGSLIKGTLAIKGTQLPDKGNSTTVEPGDEKAWGDLIMYRNI